MKVLIVGCGYVGTALARDLIGDGHEVWGLRRDVSSLKKISGLHALEADILNLRSLSRLPQTDLVVFCQAPSHDQGTDTYQSVYYQGTKNVIAALIGRLPSKIIFVSSTSVYSTHDGSWVDESTDPEADGYLSEEAAHNARSLLRAEKLVFSCGLPAVVMRLAGVYGPGRNRIDSLRAGRLRPLLNDVYTNRMHLDDIVAGIRLLAEKGKSGDSYIGADDTPCTQREFYGWLCGKLSLKPSEEGAPTEHSRHGGNKRCSNKKIKGLGLRLKYPDYKRGYEAYV